MGKYNLTEARIARKLKQKCGAGRGAAYVPWLTVGEVPSIGEAVRLLDPIHRRVMHVLSRLEFGVVLDLFWRRDVTEVREQFPLDREATRAVATDMGVRHPSNGVIDIVMTTDFLVDHCLFDGSTAQVAVCVKPTAQLENGRVLEKIEIERRYWMRYGVPLRLVTEHEVNERRRDILQWLYEWRWLDTVAVPHTSYWEERCEVLIAELLATDAASDVRLALFLDELESRRSWPRGEALSALRHLGAIKRVVLPLETFDPAGALGQVRVADTEPRSSGARNVRAA